jgi:hypothetical protein
VLNPKVRHTYCWCLFNDIILGTYVVILVFDLQGKLSLYSSWMEFQGLLKQVLSRDIRSLSQRQKPHNAILSALNEQYLNAPKDDQPFD